MKLLLDQNISFRLLGALEDAYPESTQVKCVGLDEADDAGVWHFARDNGYIIVTKDSDFQELNILYGSPPKIIWLKCGNKPNSYALKLLLDNQEEIRNFEHSATGCLEIY